MADGVQGATLGALIRQARTVFRDRNIASADLDARLLVCELAGVTATDLIARSDLAVEPTVADAVEDAVRRHADGEPVHRILGWREFHGLRLTLSPATLEPRPDTEVLVDAVLARVGTGGSPRILDLGTGTGAIALALLAAIPGATALVTDISAGALEVARRNAHLNGLETRLDAQQADWLASVRGRFDVIVSNPPYISTAELAGLEPAVVKFDPPAALHGGADGLEPYRIIAAQAQSFLVDDGLLGVEFGFRQAHAVSQIFATAGWQLLELVRDLGGNDRAMLFSPNRQVPQG